MHFNVSNWQTFKMLRLISRSFVKWYQWHNNYKKKKTTRNLLFLSASGNSNQHKDDEATPFDQRFHKVSSQKLTLLRIWLGFWHSLPLWGHHWWVCVQYFQHSEIYQAPQSSVKAQDTHKINSIFREINKLTVVNFVQFLSLLFLEVYLNRASVLVCLLYLIVWIGLINLLYFMCLASFISHTLT